LAKRALVTGGTGQDGSYLIPLLLSHDYQVSAVARRKPDPDPHGGRVDWHVGDLTEARFLESTICTAEPDEIYNLAAIASPSVSWQVPIETARLNAVVPHQLCELIQRHYKKCRLLQASSSAMFGASEAASQNETTRCDPKTPYGIAKYYAHCMVGAYRLQHGLHLSSAIMFNHESPLRPLGYVSQKIAHAAAALHLGLSETVERDERGEPIVNRGRLRLGSLDVSRDFGFAGDYVKAMFSIVQSETPGDYVIGTGESRSIAEFCDAAFRVVDLDWREHVVVDPTLIRRVDPPMCADASKLRDTFNWRPSLNFDELVRLMVERRIDAIRRTLS
jgi:GDPmannose 4,6-dehydratase